MNKEEAMFILKQIVIHNNYTAHYPAYRANLSAWIDKLDAVYGWLEELEE